MKRKELYICMSRSNYKAFFESKATIGESLFLKLVDPGDTEGLNVVAGPFGDVCEDEGGYGFTTLEPNGVIPGVDDFHSAYICRDCARERGGTSPEGLACTCHADICSYCMEEKTLCNIGDWDWPDGVARGMRD